MPPTYLGHSYRHGLGHLYIICEHLLPNHNLSQALTAGLPVKLRWVQLRRQASSCQWWIYFMWTSSVEATYSSKTIWSISGEMLKIVSIWIAFHANLSMSAIHRRCARDPLGQIGKRQLQPVTLLQVVLQHSVAIQSHDGVCATDTRIKHRPVEPPGSGKM